MVLLLGHPGVFVDEVDTAPVVVGAGAVAPVFVGMAEKGPLTLRLVTSFSQFQTEYGGFIKLNGTYQYLPLAVKNYFSNGGASCYVVRVVPTDSATAAGRVERIATPESPVSGGNDAADATATSAGAWGNSISVYCLKDQLVVEGAQVLSSNPLPSVGNGYDITVEALNDIEIGDIVWVKPTGETGWTAIVTGFDTTGANPVIHVTTEQGDTSLSDGDLITTSTTHRFRSVLTEALTIASPIDLSNGIKVTKDSAKDVVVGQTLAVIIETASPDTVRGAFFLKVTNVVSTLTEDIVYGTQLGSFFGSVAAVTSAPVGANVVSIEFDVTVFEDNVAVENHAFLSSNSDNGRDFCGGVTSGTTVLDGRLVGDNNQSNRVIFRLEADTVDDTPLNNPLTLIPVVLSGGADGTAANLDDDDYKAGIDLHVGAEDSVLLAAPDAPGNVSIQSYLIEQASAAGVKMAIIDPPLADSQGLTALQDIVAWRKNDLNASNKRGAMYWPWLVVPDPTPTKSSTPDANAFTSKYGVATINVPPSGHVCGQYARSFVERGVHKAPANSPLVGVFDVTKRIGDTDQDSLNPNGINAIRFFPGEGVRIYGARTLTPVLNGFHQVSVVNTINFIKTNMKILNRSFVFEPNDPATYSLVRKTNLQFLKDLWRDGVLFPSDDFSKAAFVVCGEETTTPSDRKAGKLNVFVGVNPQYAIEFIVMKISLTDGDASVEEVVTGAFA